MLASEAWLQSQTVTAILSNGRDKVSTGQKVFRFLVPVEKAVTNPLVKGLVDKLGLSQTSGIGSAHGRIIIYPCRAGTLLNCAAFKYDVDFAGPESSWHNAGRLEDLTEFLDEFDDSIKEFGKMAEDLKVWSLVTRDPPPTYVKGKLALIGDAAHPMLPRKLCPTWISISIPLPCPNPGTLIAEQTRDKVPRRPSKTRRRSGRYSGPARRPSRSATCCTSTTKSGTATR